MPPRSEKPIFVAVHPRACSTVFERVFMTRPDTLTCIHEPFGDAFYFGPERLGRRFENDHQTRLDSGFADCTYRHIIENIDREIESGKRVFIKDMAHYLFPSDGKSPDSIAPSLIEYLADKKRETSQDPNSNLSSDHKATATPSSSSSAPRSDHQPSSHQHRQAVSTDELGPEPGNPTVMPREILRRFHFTFLIRHPQFSIPSYYRCTIPPLSEMTGFRDFRPEEMGYVELRRLFDFFVAEKMIGKKGEKGEGGRAGSSSGATAASAASPSAEEDDMVEITLIDADDLLNHPESVIRTFCDRVNIPYDPAMLDWSSCSAEAQEEVKKKFAKWKGFHEDVLTSTSLKPRVRRAKSASAGESESKSGSRKDGRPDGDGGGGEKADSDTDGKADGTAPSSSSSSHSSSSSSSKPSSAAVAGKKPRQSKSDEQAMKEWTEKYGPEGAKVIMDCVKANMDDYLYLKQFAIRVEEDDE